MQTEFERKIMICPLNGKKCISGKREDFPKDENDERLTCRWWLHVAGKNPQIDQTVDMFDCSITWMPFLTIENSQMQRQTSASVDKVASEVAKTVNTPIHIEMIDPRVPLIDHNGTKPD